MGETTGNWEKYVEVISRKNSRGEHATIDNTCSEYYGNNELCFYY